MLDAAGHGDMASIERLVATGAPIDAANAAGQTPLLLSVQNNHLRVAIRLIDAGASINAQAANQDTPWLLAGALGRTAMLQHMLPKGPDFAIRNRFGGNALIPACERAHVDTVAVLVTTPIDVNLAAGANPNSADRGGVSPLQHARRRSQHEVAALIEAAGGR
jgi:ankyrin repeat protein